MHLAKLGFALAWNPCSVHVTTASAQRGKFGQRGSSEDSGVSVRLSSVPYPQVLLLCLSPLHSSGNFLVLTPPVAWHGIWVCLSFGNTPGLVVMSQACPWARGCGWGVGVQGPRRTESLI